MTRSLNVYLHGQKSGVLSEDRQGQLWFQYEANAKLPLSVRIPVRAEPYDHQYADPFFDNLTPEDAALQIISKKFRISDSNTFSVLDKIGGDCAGAVSLYEGNIPDTSAGGEPVRFSENEIARIIDELPDNPLLTGMTDAPRLSLAGAQSKFAVCKIEGGYYRSDDNHPTTHIVKIAHMRYPNLPENELFCMRLAKNILGTVDARLCEAAGRKYLEIERYDRAWDDGRIRRIHQEDFCQVLGVPAKRKYQNDGGPKIRDCYNAILKYSSQAAADANKFAYQVVFNYLIGNTDAHAKNFSLLHSGGRVLLSPAYDLLSAEVYPEKDISREIAMTINGKGKYDAIGKKDFLEFYEQLGINPTNAMRLAKGKFSRIVQVAQSIRDELNGDRLSCSEVYDAIIGIIKRRAERLFYTAG